jgi:hypothetical protein
MQSTNLLTALANIIENPITDLVSHYKGSNRANSMGDALENYVKDAFCNSLHEKNDLVHSDFFSYLGNQNNPPDMVIRNGDAIEVKKIEGLTSALALNSSYPKNKLYRNDSRITDSCRDCDLEPWEQKDIIYTVGVVPKGLNKLKVLWFVYGDCYAAERAIYNRVADKIAKSIKEIPDVEFIKTNELAKIKKVDPLGITDLRVRGMWHIDNPIKVFKNVVSIDNSREFTIHAIIPIDKYNSFPALDIQRMEALQSEYVSITNIKFKSPNNPAQLLDAKLISYVR